MDLDTSTLSRRVEGWVKAGLVERTQGLADRRPVRAKVSAIDQMCDRHYTELFEQLSEKDRGARVGEGR